MTFISNVVTDNSPFDMPESVRNYILTVNPRAKVGDVKTLSGAIALIADFDKFIPLARYLFESVEVSAFDHGASCHMANDADLSARTIAVMKALGFSLDLDKSQGATTFKKTIDGKELKAIFFSRGEDAEDWDITFTIGGCVTLKRNAVSDLDALILASLPESFDTMRPLLDGLSSLGFEVNNEASVDGLTVFYCEDDGREIHVKDGDVFGYFFAVYFVGGKDVAIRANRPAEIIVRDASESWTWEG